MKNNMAGVISKAVRITVLTVLCSASLGYGQPQPTPLNPQEYDAVIQEIKTMVNTNEALVEDFVVHEATPERIDRLYPMPAFLQQPKVIRENGLIFAGQGSLLTFNKPSDVINKMGAWFPQEVAAAKAEGKDWFFGHISLFGPYSNWKEEQTAFLMLWECMPQNAWLNPSQNPFLLKPNQDGFRAIAEWSSGQFDFSRCVHERSGYPPSFTEETVSLNKKIALDLGNKAAPVLQRKFAQFLSVNRCNGRGPDDCVLLLSFLSSLAPGDVALAKMLQDLDVDVSSSAPLPTLTNDDTYARGKPGFENVLRQATFLRLKQLSLTHAPTAWPEHAQQALPHQMTNLLRYDKNLGFNLGESTQAQAATLAELERLLKDSSCSTLNALLAGKPALRSTFALQHLQDAKPNCFIEPEWDWLNKGESDEARELRSRYLNQLGHQESGAVHEMLLGFLTNNGKACFDKAGAPSRDWLTDVCNNWVSEPQTSPFQLQHSHLTLDKAQQFQATSLQMPPQIPLDMDAWLNKLVDGMGSTEQQKMQALIAELHRLNGSVNNVNATWWQHPKHNKSLVYLHLSINTQSLLPRWPYDGWRFFPHDSSRLFLVFDAQSFQIVGVPERLQGDDIVQVSDLDADGNLEVWLADAFQFRECHNDDTDLERDLYCTAKTAEMGEIWGSSLSHFAYTPKANRHPSKAKQKTSNAALTGFVGPDKVQREGACNIRLVSTALKTKVDIDYGGSEQNGGRGDVINMVCKTHPVKPGQTIVAMIYEPKNYKQSEVTEYGFAVAVIDLKQNKVISLHQDTLEEDASIRIFGSGMSIDTARYHLAPGVRAFGVRMDIGYSPHCAEGGESGYLSLFVEEKTSIRPVLKNLALNSWQITGGNNNCGYGAADYTTDTVNRTLALADTLTQGWRDLQVVEHHQTDRINPTTDEAPTIVKQQKRLGVKLRLNGKMYSGQVP